MNTKLTLTERKRDNALRFEEESVARDKVHGRVIGGCAPRLKNMWCWKMRPFRLGGICHEANKCSASDAEYPIRARRRSCADHNGELAC